MMNFIKRFAAFALSLSMVARPMEAAYTALPVNAPTAQPTAQPAPEQAPAPSAETTTTTLSPESPTNSISISQLPLPKTPITLDFQDADVRDVIHVMAVKSGLNMIYGADVLGPITLHLEKVPFDQAFQTVLTLRGLVALRMGPRIIRIITSTNLAAEQSQATNFTRVFQLNYANATDIKTQLDAIRTAAGRKGMSSINVKMNSIILTDTQEGLKEAENLIPALDRKPQQVDIEAKIVEVTLDDRTTMGISWAFAQTANGGNFYGATTQATANTGPGQSGVLNGTYQTPNGPATGGTGVNFANTSQVGFSFLHGEAAYLLSAQLSALASKNKLKVLSTPHIVTTNNEVASINVADQIPYQTTTLSNGVSQTNVSFVNAGVKLTVRPTVNADHRITLKVHPEVSNAGAATFAGAPPVINTRDADTTVLLRDGETLAIGGLIKENTQKVVTGIPWLMNIPILGFFFRTTSDVKQRTELIVFLTPKIAAE